MGLRLGVKASRLLGLQLRGRLRRCGVGSDDLVFEVTGVKVYVDRAQLAAVDGTRIDFVRQGLNEIFRFENPNVQANAAAARASGSEKP